MPATAIRTSWSSGSLIFHEKTAAGTTVTYDVLSIGTAAVKIGNTSNDVDFQFYGTGSISAIIDCGAKTYTLTGIATTANYTGASATPGTVRAITGAMTTYTTQTSGNLVGVRGSITMGGACSSAAYLYGVQGKAITGANTWTGTALAGVYGQIDVSSGTITSGHVAAIQANIYGANSGTIPMEGIYVEHAGGAVINSLIQLFGKSTYVFDIASNTHNNMSTTGTPGAVTGGTGWIKCLVDGAVRYIPLASSVS